MRAYHGKADVSKHHLARMRLSMPAEEDTWICDARGDGVLVWQAPAAASLVGELRTVAKKVRQLVGPDRRPTICFDRGGYSPKLFAQLHAAGFDILTYRKGEKTPEPDDAFTKHTLVDRGRATSTTSPTATSSSPTPTTGSSGPSNAAKSPGAAATAIRPRS